MSSYAPAWVKQDSKRFERVVEHDNEIEILTPLCEATREADGRAFAALCATSRKWTAPSIPC